MRDDGFLFFFFYFLFSLVLIQAEAPPRTRFDKINRLTSARWASKAIGKKNKKTVRESKKKQTNQFIY